MTPAFWLLRALNLAAALGAAWLGSRGRNIDFASPALVFACVAAVEGALAFSGRPSDARLRRWTALGMSLVEATLIVWLSFWASATAGVFDLAYLVPAVLTGLEYGPVAGGLSGLVPAALTAAVLSQGLSPDQRGFLPVALVRAVFFVLAPAAAGLAGPGSRAAGAAQARRTLARLRAAQVGEYISFVLFQLRDYLITISSASEALVLSAPVGDPKHAERLDRLRRAAGELNAKMTRLLGDKSALTTVAPATQSATDLVALVRSVSEEAKAAFAPTGVAVDVIVHGDLPPAHTDRRPIELALLAVLQNSLEACAARGGGAVTVLLRREGPHVEIEIADDGGGIPESVKPLVFEPLASTRRGHDGMGLGLSMSRRFLERLGGGLRLKSKGGFTAALLVVPLEHELPKIRNEESTWAGRRAGT
jgi:signal transduction histidine kinase